jgi:hypothetical protein
MAFGSGENYLRRGLPTRANATIRSPPRAEFDCNDSRSARRDIASGPDFKFGFKALIFRRFSEFALQNGKTAVIFVAKVGFAPFVYRLGRHPFTVERAVRFR